MFFCRTGILGMATLQHPHGLGAALEAGRGWNSGDLAAEASLARGALHWLIEGLSADRFNTQRLRKAFHRLPRSAPQKVLHKRLAGIARELRRIPHHPYTVIARRLLQKGEFVFSPSTPFATPVPPDDERLTADFCDRDCFARSSLRITPSIRREFIPQGFQNGHTAGSVPLFQRLPLMMDYLDQHYGSLEEQGWRLGDESRATSVWPGEEAALTVVRDPAAFAIEEMPGGEYAPDAFLRAVRDQYGSLRPFSELMLRGGGLVWTHRYDEAGAFLAVSVAEEGKKGSALQKFPS